MKRPFNKRAVMFIEKSMNFQLGKIIYETRGWPSDLTGLILLLARLHIV